ncbi:hypothetical protein CSPX01_06903 [Colletotrichum filicis]|nr:hypothetical protein CSPX01_06903 [Colletotrichum filicis]
MVLCWCSWPILDVLIWLLSIDRDCPIFPSTKSVERLFCTRYWMDHGLRHSSFAIMWLSGRPFDGSLWS